MNSLSPPNPPPVDAALAAYVEQRIDERLGNERGSLLAAKREFIERLIELRSVAARVEDAMHRFAAIMELNQRSDGDRLAAAATPAVVAKARQGVASLCRRPKRAQQRIPANHDAPRRPAIPSAIVRQGRRPMRQRARGRPSHGRRNGW